MDRLSILRHQTGRWDAEMREPEPRDSGIGFQEFRGLITNLQCLFLFHDAGISHSVPCASYREPDTVSRSWWINHAQKGRVTSGRGRSEMSSSGNACWCICVRMSPGSTATTEIPSGLSSAANVFERSSSPALLDP